MEIKIGYLYYDLLNLYGENGNIKVLEKQIRDQGAEVSIDLLTIDNDLDLKKYDFLYIGAGTENNQRIALSHLLAYRDEVKEYIENGGFMLSTGNSIELFGRSISEIKGGRIETLGIFDFETLVSNIRLIGEAVFRLEGFEELFVGFQNQYGVMKDITNPLFQVIEGFGSSPDNKVEGIRYKNFYGSYLIGPILVRNPHFLKYLVGRLILGRDNDFRLKDFNLDFEINSHDKFLNKYYDGVS